jgi:hypothetical protein
MLTKTHLSRGQRISIDLFSKSGGEYAWAFKIGDGDAFGLEGARLLLQFINSASRVHSIC